MKTLTNILRKLRRRNDSEKGLETLEFAIVFIVFMLMTLLVIQVFFFFANAIAVNTALVDATQRASAQGGLTKNVNDAFIRSLPVSVCGAPRVSSDPNENGKLVCGNGSVVLTSNVYLPDGARRATDPDGNPLTDRSCPNNAVVAIGEECSFFGDRIDLIAKYSQPLLINYSCVSATSSNGSSCTNSAGALNFSQKLAVGSQSLIGQNK